MLPPGGFAISVHEPWVVLIGRGRIFPVRVLPMSVVNEHPPDSWSGVQAGGLPHHPRRPTAPGRAQDEAPIFWETPLSIFNVRSRGSLQEVRTSRDLVSMASLVLAMVSSTFRNAS